MWLFVKTNFMYKYLKKNELYPYAQIKCEKISHCRQINFWMTALTLTPFQLNVMVIHDVSVTVWILWYKWLFRMGVYTFFCTCRLKKNFLEVFNWVVFRLLVNMFIIESIQGYSISYSLLYMVWLSIQIIIAVCHM